jgi:predicted dehydrogenase
MLKGGFIGFGRMGITHFSILNTHPEVKITAVCDQSKTMLSILRKDVGIETYTDYQQMLRDVDLDFVVISTPSDSHSKIIKYAIDHNLHIFVEKPFALNAQEGRETLARLQGRNLVNQVGYVNRFNEVFVEVKKLLEEDVIGEIKNFSSEMYGATLVKDAKSSWRGKRKTGGGCMYEFASHCIDLALYLMGRPDKVVGSILQSIYSSDVEDFVNSTFVYKDGYCGTITVNWSDESYRKPKNIFKVFGTKGRLVADKHSFKVYVKEKNEPYGFHEGWNTRYITDFARSVRVYVRGNEFTRQLDYFVDCMLQKQSENIASFAEAQKVDEVIEEITQNAYHSLSLGDANKVDSPIMSKEQKKASLWKKLTG